ncbi:glutamyl-tRNA synthetase [Coemansia spiralis]|nr:glutamyl-tRNA synthetase [Coemansia spiralis]
MLAYGSAAAYGVCVCSRLYSTEPRCKHTAIEPTGPVRVRFAPSPTGMLHLGGLRTALFNYLLARRYGGSFILRIEDTDQKRIVPGATENIVRALEWAGLSIDEGPGKNGPAGTYFQSQRGDIYRKYAHSLLERGAAYRCFCDAHRLEMLRTQANTQGKPPMYDRHCMHLSQRQIDEKLRSGEPFTIRMLAPNPADPASTDVAKFSDIVHGSMHFRGPAGFDDAVLLKSDGLPTYHLANVVDDHLMGITHVLRGEEWLMSTPKHRALFKALGWAPPQYAHLPLLMNSDGSKLSKRNHNGPLQNYIDEGYLPSALVNYTALLGWHPDVSQEVFTLKELEDVFTLGGLSRSKSFVSRERLNWLNRQHLREQSLSILQRIPELAKVEISKRTVEQALRLCSDRLLFAGDLYNTAPFLFVDPDLSSDVGIQTLHRVPEDKRKSILNAANKAIRSKVRLRTDNSESAGSRQDDQWVGFAKEVASIAGVSAKQTMLMLRFALTGQPNGPKIPELLSFLPVEVVVRRLLRAVESLDALRNETA